MKVTCSAPGKVILSGEHAVVYGKPALVCAIQLRLKCTVSPANEDLEDHRLHQIVTVVKDYLRQHKIAFTDGQVDLEIDSRIPSGRGLGSSAALSVAAVAACLGYFAPDRTFTKETINSVAYKVEKLFHKNPSGVDNSASCMGGLIFYRKEFEFLKVLSSLPIKIPRAIENDLYLIDTGRPAESTAVMVQQVGDRYNKDAAGTDRLLNRIERTTKRMVMAIVSEDRTFFETCLTENQRHLDELGIVSDRAREILRGIADLGTGKITGAGGRRKGSGYVLFLGHGDIGRELTHRKIKYMKFAGDSAGLRHDH